MSSGNNRNAFRCATDASAVLREGQTDRPVELVDQSAGGFAVLGKKLRSKVGQRLLLRSSRGWSEVEVVRREVEGLETRLGLKHIADLPDPRDLKAGASNSFAWFLPLTSNPGSDVTLLGMLTLVAACAVMAFWGLLLAKAWL